jgi:hypothetical protein
MRYSRQGVEVVAGDADDEASLIKAFGVSEVSSKLMI